MQRMLKGFGVLFVVGLLVLVGLKIYAASQWPSLSEVPALELPTPIVKGDPEAWNTLEDILSAEAAADSPRRVKNIYRNNYKDEDTTLWRTSKNIMRIKEMRSFSHMELPTPPLDYSVEGVNLIPLMSLLKLNGIRSWDSLKAGNVIEAIEIISESIHVSNLLRRANGDLVSVATAVSSERYSMSVLDEILAVQAWESTEHYQAILSILQATDDDYIGTTNSLVYEALMTDRLLIDPQQNGSGSDQSLEPFWSLGYDADSSRAYSRLYWLDVIEDYSKPYLQRSKSQNFGVQIEGLSAYFHNLYGKVLLDIALPQFSSFVEREELMIARKRVLIVLCAARLYMWENDGKVPTAMSDLVPKYLAAAPRDPFGSGTITLKDGKVYSAMQYHDVQIETYQLSQDMEGTFLLRDIATPTPITIPPDDKKRRRR